jgi:N-acetylglucosamine-6-sulfatase
MEDNMMRRMVLLAIAAAATVPIGSRVVVAQVTQPNVVLIVTDDQRWDMLARMPNVQTSLADAGTTFVNAFVTDPLCCPSRTSILRGQYSHSTKIYEVARSWGGYSKVKKFGLQASMLPTWLNDAGYETGLVGKYMNQYSPTKALEVPSGWDYWAALAPRSPNDYYYNYTMSYAPDGPASVTRRTYGSVPTAYSTRVFESFAEQFIADAPPSSPVFLYFAPTAPHGPFTPDPADTSADCSVNPLNPNFGEDVSDKPLWVSQKPWSTTDINANKNRWVKQCRTLIGVDRAVGEIIRALDESGRLSNTVFVYTSDNGLMHGEHHLSGKKAAYEESIRVPMIVRYDGVVPAGAVSTEMVLNIDIAPTILEATGASAPSLLPCASPCWPRPVDGRSMFIALDGSAQWRTDFLIEHYDDPALAVNQYIPPFCAVRTNDMKYVRLDPDKEARPEELYDLERDPFELDNRIDDPAYAEELAVLRARLLELCSPAPPDYGF